MPIRKLKQPHTGETEIVSRSDGEDSEINTHAHRRHFNLNQYIIGFCYCNENVA